jgi:hypothetical protein
VAAAFVIVQQVPLRHGARAPNASTIANSILRNRIPQDGIRPAPLNPSHGGKTTSCSVELASFPGGLRVRCFASDTLDKAGHSRVCYLDWVAQVGVAIALLYFLIQLMARLFEQRWRGALFAFLRILGLVVFAFLTLCAAAFLTWRWNFIHL